MLDNICTRMFAVGRGLATMTFTRMIPMLDGDSVLRKGIPVPLPADSSLLPSHHSWDVSAVADVTSCLGEISNSA